MVTKEAITTINAGIRTLSGIKSFIKEITMFAITNTKVVAKPIPKPLMADGVFSKKTFRKILNLIHYSFPPFSFS